MSYFIQFSEIMKKLLLLFVNASTVFIFFGVEGVQGWGLWDIMFIIAGNNCGF